MGVIQTFESGGRESPDIAGDVVVQGERVEALLAWWDPWAIAIFVVLYLLASMVSYVVPFRMLANGMIGRERLQMRYYRAWPRQSSGMDPQLSQVDMMGPDELDEELDSFPIVRVAKVVWVCYKRLRVVAERAQALLGDVVVQGERVEALLAWWDPWAIAIFVVLYFLASMVSYVVPFRLLADGMVGRERLQVALDYWVGKIRGEKCFIFLIFY
uniref:FT-interacting protein 7-like n=1 Tax=Elaeis guineensis var. tenera TaxID=51953 RepID=A0A6I9Q971_ELAGV|nr:FT-interacting protein 7-like [Elaeis guineensis]